MGHHKMDVVKREAKQQTWVVHLKELLHNLQQEQQQQQLQELATTVNNIKLLLTTPPP